ncbi:MAG TPA: TIGR03435 family protein [Bryobacteraceae bacterium]|nr:TIGR03435 family protein [Bryobacteraceae bacterium]
MPLVKFGCAILRLMTAVAAALAFSVFASAQEPQFEVASVKPAAAGARGSRCAGGPGTQDPGLLTCENYSLSFLVMMAYHLHSFQLAAPGWINDARYDVMARVPPHTTVRQFESMQQKLLAQRFSLKTHFEKKEVTIWQLRLAGDGPKLKKSHQAEGQKPESLWKPPLGGPPVRTRAHVMRRGESMADLTGFLSDELGQPVVDRTGLDGRYDIELSFLVEPGGRAAGPSVSYAPERESGASLIDALRDQLGLRLEKAKGQSEILVWIRPPGCPRAIEWPDAIPGIRELLRTRFPEPTSPSR